MQVHREYFAEFVIKATAIFACQSFRPVSVAGVWLEWIWETVVEATGMAIGEAKG
jgi:hypothetical protein